MATTLADELDSLAANGWVNSCGLWVTEEKVLFVCDGFYSSVLSY